MKEAMAQVNGFTVRVGEFFSLTFNWMSWRQKGLGTFSVPPCQYSPGNSRKKNAIQASSTVACCIGITPWDLASRQWKMDIGRGCTHEG